MKEPADMLRNLGQGLRSIQTKVTLAIILILIPVTTLLSFLSFRNTQSLLRDRIFEQVITVMNAKQDQINELVRDHLDRAGRIADDDRIAAALSDSQEPSPERLRAILEDILLLYPQFEALAITSPEGLPSAHVVRAGAKSLPDSELVLRSSGNTRLYEKNGDFLISRTIGEEGSSSAMLLARLDSESFQPVFLNYSGLGTTGEILLGKREADEIVFINQPRNLPQVDSQLRLKIKDFPRLPLVLASQKLSGNTITTDYRGREVVASYRHFPLTDWGLVVKIDSEEAFAPVDRLKMELIQVSSLILILFLLVAFMVSRSITEPLQRLAVGTQKIGKGEWDYPLGIATGDEVEQLANAIKHMAQELKGLYAGLEEKVRERTSQLQQEKETSERLAEDLRKFQLAVENASDQIIITDADGHTIYANRGIETNTGYARDEVIGRNPGELWGGQMGKKFYRNMWKVIKDEKKIWEGEVTNKRKNGETYIAALSIAPITNAEGQVRFYVGIERDVTLKKEVDRMKTEFISVASHQLRTPLSAIKWFTEMLISEDAGKLTAEQKKFLEQVYASNERMIELVNALLNVSRIEQGRIAIEPKPTDLAKLVEDVMMELQPKIESKRLKVALSRHAELPKVNVDPKLIRQVYANLLSNSVKYTPDGGEINILISRKGDEIISQIKDTGYGIPKDQQQRVFTKFFRGDNILKVSAEGTGLGLYIVKSVVQSSGGKIWFESEVGKGTVFWLTLPIKGSLVRRGERSLEEPRL